MPGRTNGSDIEKSRKTRGGGGKKKEGDHRNKKA